MKFKGIIFDFNGVLLWDTELHTETWQDVAREQRGSELTEEELTRLHGRSLTEFARYVVGPDASDDEVAVIGENKEARYREIVRAGRRTYGLSPGARELLNALVARNIPRAIATSSPKSNVEFFIRHFNLLRWFERDHIVFVDGEIRGKPAPDLYIKAAEAIRLRPEQCVVVEDTTSGIASAKAAGIGKIIGLAPKALQKTLHAAGADQTIENLRELSIDNF
ncbi:HAD family phosphatase [Candidatus Kaiserbacteria bacterium]|nr:HAD family phosphatase [Candidatus Kaiserbacteria bacterium]